MYLSLSSSGAPWAAVARCRLRQQSSGEPPRLAGGQSGPGAGPAGRGADVEADAPGRVAAAAEDEMADPDLAAAHSAETDVKAGAGAVILLSMTFLRDWMSRCERG